MNILKKEIPPAGIYDFFFKRTYIRIASGAVRRKWSATSHSGIINI